MKRALITGITGQDGSYLTELLLAKGYEVHGVIRRSSSFNTGRINHIYHDPHEQDVRMFLHYGDLNDASSLNKVLRDVRPDEIYNLGAQSHVRVSFDVPEYTGEVDALGAVRLLEGIRETGLNTRFYQASSSELYGKVVETPQKETTPFYPRSPYACAKAYSYYITVNYRESYNLFACNGILFNHESPRRGETFVTRKITRAAARIKLGMQACLYLGNLEAKRDWGFAGDYVEAMWRMLQQPEPDDYVVATGETHSVKEFAEKVFARLDMPLAWQGEGAHEKGIDAKTGKIVIEIDPKYFRPAEVDLLLGDPAKAKAKLGWRPRTDFEGLVNMMVDADLAQRNGKNGPMADMTKRALICGISGQDGAYLAQLLLSKGYEVYGTARDAQMSTFHNLVRLGILGQVKLESMALNDFRSVLQTLTKIKPNELYNLAGQSSVGLSFQQPVETLESISVGTLNLLEAIRFIDLPIRFYNAGSSECFGDTGGAAADETTPFRPRSPYAVAKAAAFWEVANYREAYGLFACSGILFNHESPLRPERFVTKKIVTAACRIAAGSGEKLYLGNMSISRDWGWAPEYVEAMWLMLQQDNPDDFVIATGETNTLESFVSEAFQTKGLDWRKHVISDPSLLRPSEIMVSRGQPGKASNVLGWRSRRRMRDVVRTMVSTEQEIK